MLAKLNKMQLITVDHTT